MGTKKYWVVKQNFEKINIMFQKNTKILDFMSLWPSLEWKTFSYGIKVNINAYANKIIENTDFLNDF